VPQSLAITHRTSKYPGRHACRGDPSPACRSRRDELRLRRSRILTHHGAHWVSKLSWQDWDPACHYSGFLLELRPADSRGPRQELGNHSSCERLEIYIDGERLTEKRPDPTGFPNLQYPPFFCDLVVSSATNHDLRAAASGGRRCEPRNFLAWHDRGRQPIPHNRQRRHGRGVDIDESTERRTDQGHGDSFYAGQRRVDIRVRPQGGRSAVQDLAKRPDCVHRLLGIVQHVILHCGRGPI
jgi:hypothetical protein